MEEAKARLLGLTDEQLQREVMTHLNKAVSLYMLAKNRATYITLLLKAIPGVS